jgi:hypothetical protein
MTYKLHGRRKRQIHVPHESIKTNSPAADRRFNGKDALIDLV